MARLRGLVGLGGGPPREDAPLPGPRGGFDPDTRDGLGGGPDETAPDDGFGGEGHGKGPKPHDSQGGETPRDRPRPPMGGGGPFGPPPAPTHPTPQGPREPTPLAAGGAVTPPAPMTPFQPLPSQGAAGLASPHVGRRSLFGGAGGLFGGGLGNPLDPQSNDTSDPISSLIQSLLKKGGGSFGGGF